MSLGRRAILSALAALALSASPAAAVTQRTSLSAIEPDVMCVTCGIPLAVAESPAADQERAFIVSLVNAGKTKAQIERALVASYGNAALALPPASGFNLAVYVVPLVAAALACGLVALLLPRWRRRRRTLAPARDGGPALSAADTARLDADLARFDP